MNNTVDAKTHFGNQASVYGVQYENLDDRVNDYHPNTYRLKIFLDFLEAIKPNSVLDIGCGSGEPVIEMLKLGYNVQAFDASPDMVETAKANIVQAGFDSATVTQSDMESMLDNSQDTFDCITAMGSIYYAEDFHSTMLGISKALEKGGSFIASFRNELFSLFSLNEYTLEFLFQKCIPTNVLNSEAENKIKKSIESRLFQNKFISDSIDANRVHSTFHNPLTIADMLSQYDLSLEATKYYHFHPLPPIFIQDYPDVFKTGSQQMENSDDWRGLFMASCFVIKARKL